MAPADFRSFLWCFFGFRGRISREPYILGILATTFLVLMVLFLMLDPGAEQMQIGDMVVPMLPATAVPVLLAANVARFALTIKRLHDFNLSGWFSLIVIIPVFHVLVSLTLALLLAVIPGNPGPNRFGNDVNIPPA